MPTQIRTVVPSPQSTDILSGASETKEEPSTATVPSLLPTSTSTPGIISSPTTSPTLAPTSTATTVPMTIGLTQIASGLSRPVYLTYPPDGSGRLFIVEQSGFIRILQDGKVLPDPFLDFEEFVNSRGNEQGLLGLAFHPQYIQNGRFFIYYTRSDQAVVISRFTVSNKDPNRADPASESIVFVIPHPFANHNGGQLVFGPDGFLYIGIGDGGSGGDPYGNGQNLDVLLGKILRIDVDGDDYTIPTTNPFIDTPGTRPEIWAYGLRNPWRFSFDRQTADLYIGDVGQNQYEEIDFQPANDPGGLNYGWSFMEGLHSYKGQAPSGLVAPIAEYSHEDGSCSVTGGYVYRGSYLPDLRGAYIFGDYCSGMIWGLVHSDLGWQMDLLLTTPYNISSFGEDNAGELYVLDLAGSIYRLGVPIN